MRLFRPLLLVLCLLPASAFAGVSDRAYDRAVDLIGRLYLYPKDVTAAALLDGAAQGLADSVDWLLVDTDGNAVYLRHGSGKALGEVSVANMQTLPDALRSLERVVTESGYDLHGVDVRMQILEGMTRALDRYSRVLEGERLQRFDTRLEGTLVGIGATLRQDQGSLVVQDLVPEGPAARGGLRPGDVITRIDGVNTLNMPLEEATRRVRGEAGSKVVLSIRRGKEALERTLTRAEVVIANVRQRVLEGGIAYVQITHFSQRTVENLTGALATLRDEGALSRGIVLDLRGNTGGSMKEAARSADAFVQDGLLLRTAGPDGGQVQNLQARMDAVDEGTEPPVPIVVLMDRRTASGSEILAGALLQLDRAALLGTRSYGKGTVQKIYNLDDDARLKLTVAQYLLAGDRSIATSGLVPDVALADVVLDDLGMHYQGWGLAQTGADRDHVVPVVVEHAGWRGTENAGADVPVELARRALLRAKGPSRAQAVEAVRAVAPEIRTEQEAHLVAAIEARGIDWSPPPTPPPAKTEPPDAAVQVATRLDSEDPDRVQVTVAVTNRGTQPLYRTEVELLCDTSWAWSGLAVPLGRVDPGSTATGHAAVRLAPGVALREDEVGIRLYTDGHDPLWAGEQVVQSRSTPIPRVGIRAWLAGDGTERHAKIDVRNLAPEALRDLEVYFEAPGTPEVELVDRAAMLDVAAEGEGHIDLAVKLGAGAPTVLPMHLVIESPTYGTLAEWPVPLPADGQIVDLVPPEVVVDAHPLSAPIGPYTVHVHADDDHDVDHVVLYDAGHKVAWAGGGATDVKLETQVVLRYGLNRLTAVSQDDQGLTGSQTFYVRGEMASSVDAGGDDDAP